MASGLVVVDLSNICCDRRLDDTADLARWSRYEHLLSSLEDHLGVKLSVLAVADANLEHKLPRDDRREFRNAVA